MKASRSARPAASGRASGRRGRARRSRSRRSGGARRTRRGRRRRGARKSDIGEVSAGSRSGRRVRARLEPVGPYHRPMPAADRGSNRSCSRAARPPRAARADHLADLAAGRLRSAALALDDHGPAGRGGPAALARHGAGQRRGRHGAAVRDRSTVATGRAIGSSRFLSIVPEHRRLEIGWTWVGTGVPAHRREPRGQAAPADPRLRDARRRTGSSSRPIRATSGRATALAGIGATFEGVFRNHMIMPDGSHPALGVLQRHVEEWPAVKAAARRASLDADLRYRAARRPPIIGATGRRGRPSVVQRSEAPS